MLMVVRHLKIKQLTLFQILSNQMQKSFVLKVQDLRKFQHRFLISIWLSRSWSCSESNIQETLYFLLKLSHRKSHVSSFILFSNRWTLNILFDAYIGLTLHQCNLFWKLMTNHSHSRTYCFCLFHHHRLVILKATIFQDQSESIQQTDVFLS